MTQAETRTLFIGMILLTIGVLVYVFFAPKSELVEVQERILSEEQRLATIERAFLTAPAYALRRIRAILQRTRYSPCAEN